MTAASSRLLTEADAVDLVDRLQRSSTRARPFIVIGLVAVILGFVVLAWTLNHRLAAATALADEQKRTIVSLNTTIASSQRVVSTNLARAPADSDWHAMARLLNLADEQNDTLGATIDVRPADLNAAAAKAVAVGPTATVDPAKTAMAPASAGTDGEPKIVRLYIQIASPDQRPSAAAVAALWSGRQIGNATVVVPGIELVRSGDNTVRCTRANTCKAIDAVTGWINGTLSNRVLTAKDISSRYANSTGILPGTYEVWFAPGSIETAAVATKP